jgi:hypothetical protein
MGERTAASIGGANLAYNTVAAAVEGAAKAANLARTASADAKQVELVITEYAGRGTWLQLSSPDGSAVALARMLAPPLAKALGKAVAVFLLKEGDAKAEAFQVERSGKRSEDTKLQVPKGAFEDALTALVQATDVEVQHRQKRVYWHKPTTGNARLDRFLAQVQLATQVDISQEPDGRFAVKLLLPGGAKQMSFFNEEEVAVVRAAAHLP